MSFLGEVPSRAASIPHRTSFLPPCQERCVAAPIPTAPTRLFS
ncbi:hypothetical protein OROMI_033628 [Orobanche minor]